MFGEDALNREDLMPVRAFSPVERRLLAQMLRHGVNSPLTTSVGRLFDGVAALLGLHQRVSFEGQAAMAMEFVADATISDAYPVPIEPAPDGVSSTGQADLLDWRPLVAGVLDDLRRQVPTGIIAAQFHNALVEAIVATAQRVGEARVALSGGCFQNRWLVERAAARLRASGFDVLLHRQVPPNDGCISLGQVMVAAATLTGAGCESVPRA
jgi:hydrogenase maturation protein HypF